MSEYYSVELTAVVRADLASEACDALAEGLRETVPDWGYLEMGSQESPYPCSVEPGRFVAHIAVLLEADSPDECAERLNKIMSHICTSWAISPDGPTVSPCDPSCPGYDEGDFLPHNQEAPENEHFLMQFSAK